MTPETEIATVLPFIQAIRGQRVILDSDLARLYGVPTKQLNQQVRRNWRRFPPDFAFRLTSQEVLMRSQNVTASSRRNLSALPMAFTEHGVVMAANVLNSGRAIAMSVEIVRAFVRLRRAGLSQERLARKVAELERQMKGGFAGYDKKIEVIVAALKALIGEAAPSPKKRIGFAPHGHPNDTKPVERRP